MSNYTAGPWQLQNPEGLLSVQVVKQPDKCICTVYKLFFEDAEALANARLMAAAPELLEALQAAHRFLRKAGYDMTEIDHILDKALGVAS